ncbi:hypothetical protein [Bacillus gaemokensis]|uniref:Uncharacterized protein n=1 Tax=Bacillus gaemokensis TaxID=574375 RepID=A0A073KEP7_9BACI|nr:hypothetical protein [Bacillus gaemokensis]KEK24946.1 hypothetical protein BAGA_21995 [Bacillus gaemokensis]KYG30257.1 hypothetical protein AZF08_12990 [Bacillus gaemokensis]
MITLLFISTMIFFVWIQIKPRQIKWIDILIFLIVAGIIIYTMPRPMTWNLQAELLAITLFSFCIGVWQGSVIEVYYEGGILYIKSGRQYLISWIFLIIGQIIIIDLFEGGITSIANGAWLLLFSVVITSGIKSCILYILCKLTVRN